MVVNLYKDLKSKDPDMPYKQMMSKISETLGIGLNSKIENKRLLSKEAEKCYNIIDIFRCKKNENTFEATESESVISNTTSPSIDINASVTDFSSKLISENEKQNNNKDSMVTSIDSSEKCVTEPSLIVETDRHVNHMFNKPKTYEHHAFFKFHPVQILKDDNDYKINLDKSLFKQENNSLKNIDKNPFCKSFFNEENYFNSSLIRTPENYELIDVIQSNAQLNTRFRLHKADYKISFRKAVINNLKQCNTQYKISYIDKALNEMLEVAQNSSAYEKYDKISIALFNPNIKTPIYTGLRSDDVLTNLKSIINGVLTSNEEIDITETTFQVQVVNIPRGSRGDKIINLSTDIKTKRSEDKEIKIYLYKNGNHFDVIGSTQGFYGSSYYCKKASIDKCGYSICRNCEEEVKINEHKCYMQPIIQKGEKYLFFDYEAQQETGIHIANKIIAYDFEGNKIMFDTNEAFSGVCITDIIYRSKYLLKDTIAVLDKEKNECYSKQSITWLQNFNNKNISHALNGGEKTIAGNKHGCTKCFKDRETINNINHETMEMLSLDLYQKTIERNTVIKNAGYNLVEQWACDWINSITYKNMKKANIADPINPRDAFFRGRTNATKLSVKDTKMRYIVVCSLYPTVNYYDYYPVGHPEKIFEPKVFDKKWFGLIKCKILPPRNLYHPVLPVRK
ncbi:hypothetical protein QTP88_021061 [Uroleucon formosanum]